MAAALQLPQVTTGAQMNLQQKLFIQIAAVLAIALLTSCGTSKSTPVDQSSVVAVLPNKPLASCHRLNDANYSMNISNVTNNDNSISAEWIKVKFSFLSADITQTGYSLRFYKWRVINGASQLDSNPLEFTPYTLSNGQTVSNPVTAVFATQINSVNGFYIRLNDDLNAPYQVLKVVAYKTDGTVAAQSNVLIPQFLASPVDYATNPDGSGRAELLQKMHPLFSTDISQWSQQKLKDTFQQYCF